MASANANEIEVKRVCVEPLTRESFAPFGTVLAPDGLERVPVPAYEDSKFVYRAAVIESDRPVEFMITRSKVRDFRVVNIERHLELTQAFVPLRGDPIVLVVARADAEEDEDGIPALDEIHAFVVPGGAGVQIYRGVWHVPPFPLVEDSLYIWTSHAALTDGLTSSSTSAARFASSTSRNGTSPSGRGTSSPSRSPRCDDSRGSRTGCGSRRKVRRLSRAATRGRPFPDGQGRVCRRHRAARDGVRRRAPQPAPARADHPHRHDARPQARRDPRRRDRRRGSLLTDPIPHRTDPARLGGKCAEVRCLAVGKVVYAGQPVAAAVGTNRNDAEAALDLVTVDYEELPFVLDADEALSATAPRLYEDWADNVLMERSFVEGDVDQAMAEADHVLDGELAIQRLSSQPIETRGYVASWDPRSATFTLHASTQNPHQLRWVLAQALRVDEPQLRVIAPHLGGSSG